MEMEEVVMGQMKDKGSPGTNLAEITESANKGTQNQEQLSSPQLGGAGGITKRTSIAPYVQTKALEMQMFGGKKKLKEKEKRNLKEK